ncbi:LOB domain-containing protein 41 [Dendrobium catenatum]|uniref:LOB domain-containing protein 41 n=1 Tax=Dendrobium catenatum TaxID=906689 RepID=A0A2I0WH71_9ASPA|nr:LOB domain-containing protein 41 [Dendrobium catenatum]
MRMSCNGCRVLRKGCSDNCSIRPCLQWIKNPEAQANATVFLAKFYGRAGLMNLINAGPEHVRPGTHSDCLIGFGFLDGDGFGVLIVCLLMIVADIFRSLLYEACGRIVNPIYGSVGLLWSGSWQLCQSAVESVLRGSPIVSISSEAAESSPAPPLKGYDIRHSSKEGGGYPVELHKVGKCRTRFKRAGADAKTRAGVQVPAPASPESSGRHWCYAAPTRSHESAGSRPENESMFSVETVEASHVSQGEPNHSEEGEMGLELTLGLEPLSRRRDDARWCGKTSPAAQEDYGADLQLELAV